MGGGGSSSTMDEEEDDEDEDEDEEDDDDDNDEEAVGPRDDAMPKGVIELVPAALPRDAMANATPPPALRPLFDLDISIELFRIYLFDRPFIYYYSN